MTIEELNDKITALTTPKEKKKGKITFNRKKENDTKWK